MYKKSHPRRKLRTNKSAIGQEFLCLFQNEVLILLKPVGLSRLIKYEKEEDNRLVEATKVSIVIGKKVLSSCFSKMCPSILLATDSCLLPLSYLLPEKYSEVFFIMKIVRQWWL